MANAAFALIVRTAFAPVFFKNYAAENLPPAVATSYWGFVSSAAGIAAGILAPWLGVIADANSRRKRFLGAFMSIGILAVVALCFTQKGDATLVLVLYFISMVAYMGSNSFYDSLLVEISPRGSFHRLSALAYAWGYIGGLIPFIFCLGLLMIAGSNSITMVKCSFLIAAAWWGVLAYPLFRNVQEKTYPSKPVHLFEGLQRLIATAREIGKYRNVVIFLIAYFLYIDGVSTIFLMAAPISQDIGITPNILYGTILALQFLGFPFTILYGRLARVFPARKLVYLAISIYILITIIIGIIPTLNSSNAKLFAFLGTAFLIGTSQGGIQSLSRSIFSQLIPREHASEFFGFYNIFGKFTTILGPILLGIAVWFFGRSEYGIMLLAIPFLAGGCLLSRVNISNGKGKQ